MELLERHNQDPRTPKAPKSSFTDDDINKMIEEEKQLSENNGYGIHGYKMGSYPKPHYYDSPDRSAIDMDNTIEPFDLTDRKNAEDNPDIDNFIRKKSSKGTTEHINDGGMLNLNEDEY